MKKIGAVLMAAGIAALTVIPPAEAQVIYRNWNNRWNNNYGYGWGNRWNQNDWRFQQRQFRRLYKHWGNRGHNYGWRNNNLYGRWW